MKVTVKALEQINEIRQLITSSEDLFKQLILEAESTYQSNKAKEISNFLRSLSNQYYNADSSKNNIINLKKSCKFIKIAIGSILDFYQKINKSINTIYEGAKRNKYSQEYIQKEISKIQLEINVFRKLHAEEKRHYNKKTKKAIKAMKSRGRNKQIKLNINMEGRYIQFSGKLEELNLDLITARIKPLAGKKLDLFKYIEFKVKDVSGANKKHNIEILPTVNLNSLLKDSTTKMSDTVDLLSKKQGEMHYICSQYNKSKFANFKSHVQDWKKYFEKYLKMLKLIGENKKKKLPSKPSISDVYEYIDFINFFYGNAGKGLEAKFNKIFAYEIKRLQEYNDLKQKVLNLETICKTRQISTPDIKKITLDKKTIKESKKLSKVVAPIDIKNKTKILLFAKKMPNKEVKLKEEINEKNKQNRNTIISVANSKNKIEISGIKPTKKERKLSVVNKNIKPGVKLKEEINEKNKQNRNTIISVANSKNKIEISGIKSTKKERKLSVVNKNIKPKDNSKSSILEEFIDLEYKQAKKLSAKDIITRLKKLGGKVLGIRGSHVTLKTCGVIGIVTKLHAKQKRQGRSHNSVKFIKRYFRKILISLDNTSVPKISEKNKVRNML